MSDTKYPIIEPDGEELFFQNAWRSDLPQTLGDTECFDFNAQPNEDENLIVMKLTGVQLVEMLSALYIGAEFVYPEKFLEVIRPLLGATSCPPLLSEQECVEYPTYASFMRYSPMSPYVNPNEIPTGYETEPFLANGENGVNLPNYEHFDVIVPNTAITFDVDWFSSISGQLPTIEIVVQGAGQALIKMLTLAQGGLAVITVDNPPDLLDIIGGVVTGAENIIDLNQDLVSLPPETAQEIIFPLDIVGSGLHTIYIVFLPILDDSLIPLRFGGGFRGVQLCNFVAQGESGLQNLRFLNCNLEQQNTDGSWSIVQGWEDWLDCIPTNGGGGGGGALLKTTHFTFDISSSVTNSTTTPQTAFSLGHVLTYPNAIVIWNNVQAFNSASGIDGNFRAQLDNVNGQGNLVSIRGTAARELTIVDTFLNKAVGASLSFQLKFWTSTTPNTITASSQADVELTIIEFASAEDLYVEDVRIFGRELQKKIGGAWITVSDSLAAILNGIETIANNASLAASAAQSSANNALSVANGAVTVNNTQNTRLNNAETAIYDLEVDAASQAVSLANHEVRIDALEAAILTGVQKWETLYDFMSSDNGWSGNPYVGGSGFQFGAGLPLALAKNSITVFDSRVEMIEVEISVHNAIEDFIISFPISSNEGTIRLSSGGFTLNWLSVPALTTPYTPVLRMPNPPLATRYLRKLRVIGFGSFNPFN